jgi:hypothetical protein
MAEKKNGQATAGTQQGQGAGQATITKQEAVRRALAHFGNDAKPAQMQGWIRDHLGIEMTPGHITTAKGEILRKAGVKGKQGAKKPAAPKVAVEKAGPNKPAPKPQVQPSPASRSAANAFPLTDILYVKGLVERFGPSPLHTLIDAFAG